MEAETTERASQTFTEPHITRHSWRLYSSIKLQRCVVDIDTAVPFLWIWILCGPEIELGLLARQIEDCNVAEIRASRRNVHYGSRLCKNVSGRIKFWLEQSRPNFSFNEINALESCIFPKSGRFAANFDLNDVFTQPRSRLCKNAIKAKKLSCSAWFIRGLIY